MKLVTKEDKEDVNAIHRAVYITHNTCSPCLAHLSLLLMSTEILPDTKILADFKSELYLGLTCPVIPVQCIFKHQNKEHEIYYF